MQVSLRYPGLIACLGLLFVVSFHPLRAQQRLDLGVHIAPQMQFVHSELRPGFGDDAVVYTEGGKGVAAGYGVGAYLEYELVGGLSLRAGVDLARKRYTYDVRISRPDTLTQNVGGTNRIVFMAMEVPVSLIYRFGFLPNDDQLLVGAGGVIARWIGDPQLETDFYRGSATHPPFTYSPYSLKVFAGYERYVSSRFVLGVEPFLSYSPQPNEFRLESRTTAVADLEAGLSVTLRFDN